MGTGRISLTTLALVGLSSMIAVLPRFCQGAETLVRFGPETARADLLNRVSERVFSLVETAEDDAGPTAIVKSAFTNALKSVLTAVKGEVHEACDELAEIAAQKIHEAEQRGELVQEGGSGTEDYDMDLSFLDSPRKTGVLIKPHGFLQETKFMDALKTFARGALSSLAEPMKQAIVQGIRPILPKIKDAAVRVFREACQEAEAKVQEA